MSVVCDFLFDQRERVITGKANEAWDGRRVGKERFRAARGERDFDGGKTGQRGRQSAS